MKHFLRTLLLQLLTYTLVSTLNPDTLYGQENTRKEATVTLKMSNEKIGTILDTISKQTALEFAYSGQFIDIERRINVEVKNAPLSAVLKLMFTGLNMKSYQQNNTIFIVPSEVKQTKFETKPIDEPIVIAKAKPASPKKAIEKPTIRKYPNIPFGTEQKIALLPFDVVGEQRFRYEYIYDKGDWKPIKGVLILTPTSATLVDSTNTRRSYKLKISEKRRNYTQLDTDNDMFSDRCMTERIDLLADRQQYLFKMNYETENEYYYFSLNLWNNPILFTIRVVPIK